MCTHAPPPQIPSTPGTTFTISRQYQYYPGNNVNIGAATSLSALVSNAISTYFFDGVWAVFDLSPKARGWRKGVHAPVMAGWKLCALRRGASTSAAGTPPFPRLARHLPVHQGGRPRRCRDRGEGRWCSSRTPDSVPGNVPLPAFCSGNASCGVCAATAVLPTLSAPCATTATPPTTAGLVLQQGRRLHPRHSLLQRVVQRRLQPLLLLHRPAGPGQRDPARRGHPRPPPGHRLAARGLRLLPQPPGLAAVAIRPAPLAGAPCLHGRAALGRLHLCPASRLGQVQVRRVVPGWHVYACAGPWPLSCLCWRLGAADVNLDWAMIHSLPSAGGQGCPCI